MSLVELHAFDNETCRYEFSTTRMSIWKGLLISFQPLLISISLLSINFMAEFCCEIIFMLGKSCILCLGGSQHNRWLIEFCRSFAPRANPIAMPHSLKIVMGVNGIWRGFVWVPKLFKIPYSYSDGWMSDTCRLVRFSGEVLANVGQFSLFKDNHRFQFV